MNTPIAATATLVVILSGAFTGIHVADSRYAPMSVATELQYKSFYDYLEKAEKAREEGNEPLAREYERQMERLKAQICKQDPAWERC
jgi:hypothetical protein